MESCEIQILKWDEYQGEAKRYETTAWFRIENTMWMHALWDELTDAEFKAMIFLWSYVSQKAHKTGKAVIAFKTLSRMSGIKCDVLVSCVKKLAGLGIAKVTEQEQLTLGEPTVTAPGKPSEVHVLRNVTIRNDPNTCAPRFDELYKKYPRKRGKAAALKFFKKKFQTPEEVEQLSSAIDAFAADCKKRGTEERFIPHFSSFIGDKEVWRDFVQTPDTPAIKALPAMRWNEERGCYESLNEKTMQYG